jgi:hypothetical protein
MKRGSMSVTSTYPDGPTRCAIQAATEPLPPPISRQRQPGPMPAVSRERGSWHRRCSRPIPPGLAAITFQAEIGVSELKDALRPHGYTLKVVAQDS